MAKTNKLSFSPQKVTKSFLAVLPERSKSVLKKRFGLDEDVPKMTLEAIGKSYKITRERVRQIENSALSAIRKSPVYGHYKAVFDELKNLMHEFGAIVHEQDFLEHISKDKHFQNHVNFFLVLGEEFERLKEDDEFKHRWTIDSEMSKKVEESLKSLYKSLSEEDLISESEMIIKLFDHLKHISKEARDEELARRWLSLSKNIDKNSLGEWGIAHSPNIKTRGIRDLAYLILRRHGSPMHFEEVAKAIQKVFGKEANVATCHNELIKDKRFVLVGRGLYALSKWGYERGNVRDIIRIIIGKDGPQTKEDILKKVLRERYVKENTVLVNLQNSRYFKKDKDGKYSIA
ncbi:MAG: sigma factor-like helix-turn-helix DNA-binding protein [bacterium]|nr:sigma factor-like helix-turn-helix DNA-binding protein [bacterium]